MDPDSHFAPPPPPPPGVGRPPLGRLSSWERVSPVNAEGGPVLPPPPPPPPAGDDVPAASPGSSQTSSDLDGDPSDPRSGVGQLTPEMWNAVRKFMEAGGYEGMKKQIVEEACERLKSVDSDRDSTRSAPSPPPPPTFVGRPPVPREGSQISPQLSGPPLPHTPPESPHQKPQTCPPGSKRPSSSGPPAAPGGPRKSGRGADLNGLDKSWGELFDAEGKATKRLREVLRGIASYLISQASPVESVVITPGILSAFYRGFSVDNEAHPYPRVFECVEDDRKDYEDIEDLYDDLGCEYHLVKSHPTSPKGPIVPALTPAGFVRWIIMAIYAYPDEEAQRLDAIMSRLPIDAECDGKPERLPKRLSRHLLPSRPDKASRRNFDEAVEKVSYRRSVREKKSRRASYGSGTVRSRPMNRRSESEPVAYTEHRRPPLDDDDEPPKKHVSFGRPKHPAANGAVQSRRPSSERTGRSYSLHSGKISVPSSSERHEEPVSPTSGGLHFELSSGRDRDRDRDREYRYSKSATPRRMSGEEVRGGSRTKSGRKPEVMVRQDKVPHWKQILLGALESAI